MTHTATGNVGEAVAIAELTKLGYTVSVPLVNNCAYDLVIEQGGVLSTVQVKTTSQLKPSGGWSVYIATSGGNTRQNTIKHFDASKCTYLFVMNSLYECWLIPTAGITGKHYVTVGGQQFTEYKLSPDRLGIGEPP